MLLISLSYKMYNKRYNLLLHATLNQKIYQKIELRHSIQHCNEIKIYINTEVFEFFIHQPDALGKDFHLFSVITKQDMDRSF